MKLIKNRVGASFVEVILALFIVLLMFSIIFRAKALEDAEKNFKTYFSMDIYQGESERNLVKPLVNKRLEELKGIANEASAKVQAIRDEPESLDPDILKEKLERLNEAKMIERSAWSDWERACRAAKWGSYVMSCDATR